MTERKNDCDWALTTWKGSRLHQHQIHLALPFREKLKIVEQMCDRTRELLSQREKAGLPYIDPLTGKAVRPVPRIPGT
jgi:hypothetical protein